MKRKEENNYEWGDCMRKEGVIDRTLQGMTRLLEKIGSVCVCGGMIEKCGRYLEWRRGEESVMKRMRRTEENNDDAAMTRKEGVILRSEDILLWKEM